MPAVMNLNTITDVKRPSNAEEIRSGVRAMPGWPAAPGCSPSRKPRPTPDRSGATRLAGVAGNHRRARHRGDLPDRRDLSASTDQPSGRPPAAPRVLRCVPGVLQDLERGDGGRQHLHVAAGRRDDLADRGAGGALHALAAQRRAARDSRRSTSSPATTRTSCSPANCCAASICRQRRLPKRYAFRRASLTQLGRSAALLIGTRAGATTICCSPSRPQRRGRSSWHLQAIPAAGRTAPRDRRAHSGRWLLRRRARHRRLQAPPDLLLRRTDPRRTANSPQSERSMKLAPSTASCSPPSRSPANACAPSCATTACSASRRAAMPAIAAPARSGWTASRCIPAWCRHFAPPGARSRRSRAWLPDGAAASAAAGVSRRAGIPMRLLRRRHDHDRRVTRREQPRDLPHALKGNLCRCTGYRAIADALHGIGNPPKQDIAGKACGASAGEPVRRGHRHRPCALHDGCGDRRAAASEGAALAARPRAHPQHRPRRRRWPCRAWSKSSPGRMCRAGFTAPRRTRIIWSTPTTPTFSTMSCASSASASPRWSRRPKPPPKPPAGCSRSNTKCCRRCSIRSRPWRRARRSCTTRAASSRATSTSTSMARSAASKRASPRPTPCTSRPIRPRACSTSIWKRTARSPGAATMAALHVRTSSQAPFIAQQKLCHLFGLRPRDVHVFTERVGGGFGGKQEMISEDLCVLATLKTGRPVKWEFTREEQFIGATTRHQMTTHVKLGAKRDGTLTAIEVQRRLQHRRLWRPCRRDARRLARQPAGRLSLRQQEGRRLRGLHQHGSRRRLPRLRRLADHLRHRMRDGRTGAACSASTPFEIRRKNMIRPTRLDRIGLEGPVAMSSSAATASTNASIWSRARWPAAAAAEARGRRMARRHRHRAGDAGIAGRRPNTARAPQWRCWPTARYPPRGRLDRDGQRLGHLAPQIAAAILARVPMRYRRSSTPTRI